MLDGPTTGDIQLDLLLTKKEELSGEMKINGSLGCSNHEIVKFKILKGARKSSSGVQIVGFSRAEICFFRKLVSGIP